MQCYTSDINDTDNMPHVCDLENAASSWLAEDDYEHDFTILLPEPGEIAWFFDDMEWESGPAAYSEMSDGTGRWALLCAAPGVWMWGGRTFTDKRKLADRVWGDIAGY